MATQRTLGVLLGLQAAYQARGTRRSPEEEEYHEWLKSEFFAGGLQVLQPKNQFEEEKGESRGSASGGTTPGNMKKLILSICIHLTEFTLYCQCSLHPKWIELKIILKFLYKCGFFFQKWM